jgi:hypothetical protein
MNRYPKLEQPRSAVVVPHGSPGSKNESENMGELGGKFCLKRRNNKRIVLPSF